jgi:translation elongation factor EF-4
VFLERLAQEHRAAVISTAPTVTYHLQLAGGEELVLDNMTDYPRDKKVGWGRDREGWGAQD